MIGFPNSCLRVRLTCKYSRAWSKLPFKLWMIPILARDQTLGVDQLIVEGEKSKGEDMV